jgi:hypothetical protein
MKQDTDWKKKAQDIFKLLNDYRKNPRLLSKHLEGLKRHLDKNKVLTEPNKIPIQMVEGEDVINEAVQYLNGLKSLPPFELDPYLCQSAQEHVDDIGPRGLLSYQSSDGTEPEDRIGKFGNYIEALGENIDFGPNDAQGVIVSLTLDDGEEERPHRDNLFKADYRKIGIACGPHKTEYQMCVMDFAFDFVPHDDNQGVKDSHYNQAVKDHNYNQSYNNVGKANNVNQIPQQQQNSNYIVKQESKQSSSFPYKDTPIDNKAASK